MNKMFEYLIGFSLITVFTLSSGTAIVSIPGCPSLLDFDFDYNDENDENVPTCFCDNSTETSTSLIQINCIFNARLDDVVSAIKYVHDAGGEVDKIKLEYLYVDPNEKIPNDFFKKNNVTPSEVQITNCRTPESLAEHTFRGLETSLIYLKVSKCILNAIPANLNQLTKLEFLDLSYDGIEDIGKDDMSGLKNLLALDLSGNGLRSVQSGTFKDMKNLKTLYLGDGNQLNATILKETKDLSSLVLLDLSANQIDVVPDGAFAKMENLTALNLQTNLIKDVKKETFRGLNTLIFLDLFQNLIKNIEAGAFADLPYLQWMTLNNNFLSSVRPETFKSDSLVSLSLMFNDFEKLDKNAFKMSPSLQTLDLSSNSKLSSIDVEAFSGLSDLFLLRLAYTNISTLDGQMFKPLLNLSELDFGNTFVESVNKKTFANVQHLQVLRFPGTKVKHLPENVFADLKDMQELDVYDNEWVCDKSVEWFVKWLKANNDTIIISGDPACASPDSLKGVRLLEVNTKQLE